ncbi:SRPBCC family protein [Streptomyces sp. NPDC002004]
MPALEEHVDITAPSSAVWNQLHKVENYPRFVGGVREARREGSSGLHVDVESSGRTRGIDARTEDRPDETMTWKTTSTPHLSGTISVTKLDDTHTRVKARVEYDPTEAHDAFGGPKGFAQSNAIERTVREDLNQFKSLVEESSPGTTR